MFAKTCSFDLNPIVDATSLIDLSTIHVFDGRLIVLYFCFAVHFVRVRQLGLKDIHMV